jgi:microcystin-dependent protein
MSEPYIGEIIAVGFFFGNGFSQSWLPCNGQLLPISEYEALYSLIGTIYGGDGQSNFALPNLNGDGTPPHPGRVAISQGTGPGLSNRVIGETIGVNDVTLTANQLASHTHQMQLAQAGTANATPGPGSGGSSVAINPSFNGFVTDDPDTSFSPNAITPVGSSQPHPNNQPTNGLWYLICYSGIYPSFG